MVSSGSFPGLFQEIFHFRVRSIRTPGMHLKGNHEPFLFPECCPVLNNIWKAVSIQQRNKGSCSYCVGIYMFSPAFKIPFSFFTPEKSNLKWIGFHSYSYIPGLEITDFSHKYYQAPTLHQALC